MWTYLANSLGWSLVGLLGGGVLTELGYDLSHLLRRNHSGRRKDEGS